MKKGILRVLGVVVTLALLIAALPASIASAAIVDSAEVVNSRIGSPYYGEARGVVGDTVNISGKGESKAYLSVYFSDQKALVNDNIGVEVTRYKEWQEFIHIQPVDSFIANLVIPTALLDGDEVLTQLHGGIYYFYLVKYNHDDNGPGTPTTKILYVIEFEVVGIADVNIDKTTGPVGTVVNLQGEGFAKSEYIDINYFHNPANSIPINNLISGSDHVGSDGKFKLSFAIPESTNGKHNIVVQGASSLASETLEFTVTPSVMLNKSSGRGGDNVIVYAKGFLRSSNMDIFIGNIKLDDDDSVTISDKTDITGSLTYIITIPASLASGTYDILVKDETTNSINATTSFEITSNSILALSTSTGNVGSAVTVTGTNFAPNTALNILFDTRTIGNVTTDALGNFSKEITIPAAACGVHIIKVGDSQQNYTVTSKMTLDKTQGVAGTTVTATGSGFAAGTTITAKFNGAAVALTSTVTDVAGNFTTSFTVPAIATGTYVVEIAAGNVLTANFNILETEVVDPAAIALNTSTVKVGDIINITGTNFAAGANIALTIDGDAVFGATPITTTTNGAFATSLIIPTIAGGAHTLSVTDGTNTKTVQFTVTAKASMTPTSGNVGSSVTVSGDGFIANTNLTIKYDGVAVANAILPLTGAFINTAFTVPASAGGAHTVAVTDGINTVELTFTMETTAPSKPALTAPSSASKEKGIVTFDWDDSTDDSMPVTYTLQVATDAAFTGIIFTQTGLTASTYTLTEAQKLDKLPDGGSYYWRVIAKDAANNSVTSDVSTFVVGGSLPGWLMWVWIGIGVVVVFIFAVWLGRRMAYSSY